MNLPLEAELTATFTRVLHSGRFIMGPEVEALEAEVAEFVGARHGIGVTSGTDAILVALMALGIGPGDEVLCPAFTFFATAGCISRTGATPVFVDACPGCFNLDPDDAARKVTERTKAIIPVHLFGQSAEMDAVMALARELPSGRRCRWHPGHRPGGRLLHKRRAPSYQRQLCRGQEKIRSYSRTFFASPSPPLLGWLHPWLSRR